MSVCLRRGKVADAPTLGEICYSAFKAIAEAHNFPPDFPNAAAAAALLAGYINHERIFDVVGEKLMERSSAVTSSTNAIR